MGATFPKGNFLRKDKTEATAANSVGDLYNCGSLYFCKAIYSRTSLFLIHTFKGV
jgi:hypothetical protein